MKIVMTRGLPASGKSTWTREYIQQHSRTIDVNKDKIRKDLGEPWSQELEKKVLRIQATAITEGLKAGYDVIVSDTNLAPKHEPRLRQIAKQFHADFEVKSFLDVPLEECVRRDSLRSEGERVGAQVILDMYDKYVRDREPVIVPYVPDITTAPAIICDLDGTLALHVARGPYEYQKCDTDQVSIPVAEVITSFYWHLDWNIIYLSGRDESCRELTVKWINDNRLPEPKLLYMRRTGDHRKDSVVKLELFDKHIRHLFNVKWAIDDRPQVLRLWRSLGIFTFQVGDGHEF